MNEKLRNIQSKFDALQQREKVMVAGLIFVLLIASWQILVFDEAATNLVKIKNQIKAQQQQNMSMKSEIAAYHDRSTNNPNSKLKKQQSIYLEKIEALDRKLNVKMKGLISPVKMTAMLKDIFKSNTNLTLISLDKLKAQSMFDFSDDNKNSKAELKSTSVTDDVGNKDNNNSAVVYRHPVKIVFNGSFLNAMNYLKAIEEMPWDLYWDTVQLDVEKYPTSRIVITVFTLSLKKGWVGV